MKGFQIAGGSVPGTDHTKPGQPAWTNNQDAFAWRRSGEYLLAVVCDGCSSTPHSEVGAKIGAQFTLNAVQNQLVLERSLGSNRLDEVLKHARHDVLRNIERLGWSMFGPDRDAYEEGVLDYFLFTIMGLVVTPEETVVFSLGDGIYATNGEVTSIEQYEGNAPPYLGYACMQSLRYPGSLNFQIRAQLPTQNVQSLVIGTDGAADAGPLDRFWQEDIFVTNPDKIRRELAIMNRERVEDGHIKKGLLRDDTTLVVVRRIDTEE